MTKKTPAGDQFAALGLNNLSDWTPAMNLAVKQKWAGLPVDAKVSDLRDQLAALPEPVAPTADGVRADMTDAAAGVVPTDDEVAVEMKRLKRNAAVNAWRTRNQLQAALDARNLKFAALRAKKNTKVAAPAAATGDVARLAS